MSVDRRISIATIKSELEKCHEYSEKYDWVISEINEGTLSFTVLMVSPIDKERYTLEIQFDNYPQTPPLIEFINTEGVRGAKNAYPKSDDSFFHSMPCICNPCSRKSYKEYSQNAPHGEWQLDGWRSNPKAGNLTTINRILATISHRINAKKHYKGRMS